MSFNSLIAILVVLLFLSAVFSASEAALISINKIRLRHMLEKKQRGARRVYGIVQRMDKFIATILAANSLANTAIASIATVLIAEHFGQQNALIYGTIFVTIFLVIFCELTPKIIATNHPEGVAFFVRHFISFLLQIFKPITVLLTWVSNGFIRILGGNPHARSPLITEEELKMMITIGKEQGIYGDNERKMLEKIFHFDEVEVRDVMTPLEQMTAIPIDIAGEDLERVLMEEGHNRIPVYKDRKENIIGILYVRDLVYIFRNEGLFKIEDLMSAPHVVPATKKASELLREFQSKKIQIAIVSNGPGRTLGLVTLEDLIEEIVGEIEEEKL